MCIPWSGTRTQPQGRTIVSWLLLPCLCIPSLPWLATVQICPLELREGHGGWSLFPTRNRGTWKGFCAQEPLRVLLSFMSRSWSVNKEEWGPPGKGNSLYKDPEVCIGWRERKTQSLQTAWPFWSCNNHGAGGKRGEIKLKGARERGQAIPKLQECTWRDLEFILRTGGNQKGFSAGKRRNGMGISSFCHQGGGRIRGVRLWVESPTGSLAVSRKSILRTQRRAMPMMMTRRELDFECNEDWSARGDLQFSLQSSEAQLNSLNHVPYFVNSWHNALHRMCACMLSRSVMSNSPWTVQGKILEWIATSYSRESSNPGIEHVSPALSGWFYHFATREALPQDRSLIKSCYRWWWWGWMSEWWVSEWMNK